MEASPLKPALQHSISTPSAVSATLSQQTPKPSKIIQLQYRLSMEGRIILCPYSEMMNRYLPIPPRPVPHFQLTTGLRDMMDDLRRNQTTEVNMYEHLTTTLNRWLKLADADKKPKFRVVISGNKSDPDDWTKQRIDGGVYEDDEKPTEDHPPKWEALELGIEVKRHHSCDFFSDEYQKGYSPNSEVSKSALGQAMSYSSLVFFHQHRTHHFSILIFGTKARIVRWDRAGLLFTNAFDYFDEPQKLGEFLWRYAQMDSVDRGHDPTVTRVVAKGDEDTLMDTRAKVSRKVEKVVVDDEIRKLFDETVSTHGPRHILRVQGKKFLVGKPHTYTTVLAGRGTRGYIAIDLDDPKGPFVFLKDTWRVVGEGLDEEGKVLLDLNSPDEQDQRGRKYIPTLVCHGDLEGRWQKTDSQDFWLTRNPNSDQKCPMRTHQHYRLVVKEVGLPISNFRNGREMVTLISHGVAAHGYGYKKGYMHRDISAGNLLIFVRQDVVNGQLKEERHGLLTDWELAKKLADKGPRQLERTGTWQFLAVDILNNPSKPVEVWHEMESWFHLTLWLAVQYLPHNVQNVAVFMSEFFDDAAKPDDGSTHQKCGTLKRTSMETGRIRSAAGTRFKFGAQDDPFVPHAINKVLAQLARAFSYRYQEQELLRTNAEPWLEGDVADLTPAQLKALENIDDQVRFEELLLEYINGPGWPENDKTAPQVSLSEREPFPSSYPIRGSKRPPSDGTADLDVPQPKHPAVAGPSGSRPKRG
ncbi:other/FunK1 protein kinase [Coprinopsis cinerea okayama7|uniref:Other/FunK1 protein kinase n=1 Tax=Coprinopsis cinerea (strain Okayama-7 / 130 / ATCC MYA-4618 / FGSC 9003) TaxID=240176 RepID=D6RNE9_COPC7|nr:other/FunK1 protein kinase [Coprinopsis cinerea okayama7\|eukprot:XP_002911077.1 other/FunK1 protein kinase [Coprinopsis cinerea okayama7\